MGGEGVEVGEEEFGGNRPTAGEGEGGGAGAAGVGAEGLEVAERGSRSAGQEGQLVWWRALGHAKALSRATRGPSAGPGRG